MMGGLKTYAKRAVTIAAMGGSMALLAGCYEAEYYSQRDTLTLGAGDAVAANIATQTIDPWPPHAKDTDIDLQGPRAAVAVERYQSNTSLDPRGLTNGGKQKSKGASPTVTK